MMFDEGKRWCVRPYQTAGELVDHFKRCSSWCGCAGFRLGDLVFLNDQTCEDGAGEYAAIDMNDGRQFDSITLGWMSGVRMMAVIEACLDMIAGREAKPSWFADQSEDYRPRMDHMAPDRTGRLVSDHRCAWCA